MNLVADESVGKSIVGKLRHNGYNVLYIAEFAPSIDDETVLYQANQNRALLLTEDKDFGELVFRQGQIHMGVVLIPN
jgi:predicted nuclease of predicted toxin-antitoxin system